ncbi:MYG1 family protein [Candidatus Parcubacteria bacterium]|nr:MYG1 family protein [Candidatus Parcubacteria bacterium]
MIKIVTHDAKFHADDVFGVAALYLLLGEENVEVTRTRDAGLVNAADYALDLGGVFDPAKNRFDHHQMGGAGKRDNGIQYASFGLIWKTYGDKIAGLPEVAAKIDQTLTQLIDAGDNGQDIITPNFPNVFPFTVNGIVDLYRPTWKEEENWDKSFFEAVRLAKWIITREIKITSDAFEAQKFVKDAYEKSTDRRLIIMDESHDFGREIVMNTLVNFPEPIYAVLYRAERAGTSWQVLAIKKDPATFASRKPLPESWRAKDGQELEQATGVKDAKFCHRSGFMCLAASKEGALALAKKALEQ